jgi:hypothetical protein
VPRGLETTFISSPVGFIGGCGQEEGVGARTGEGGAVEPRGGPRLRRAHEHPERVPAATPTLPSSARERECLRESKGRPQVKLERGREGGKEGRTDGGR